jgi:beta-phosphoglucomutase family hydrolase
MEEDNVHTYYDGGICDLDGVVTHTAMVHSRAWKKMFDEYLIEWSAKNNKEQRPFDMETDYPIYVDGKPRYQGAQSFFESRGIELPFGNPSDPPRMETVCGLGNRKNEFYRELVNTDGVGIFDPTVDFIKALREKGYKVGLMSSSKNTRGIIRIAGLVELFDAVVDGVTAEEEGMRGKPHPDVYLRCAELLNLQPWRAFVVEDAASGVEAGSRGEFGVVVGLAHGGQEQALRDAGADVVISDPADLSVEAMDSWFAGRASAGQTEGTNHDD